MHKALILALIVAVAALAGCEGPHVWDYQVFMPKEADLVGTYKISGFHGDVDNIDGFSRKDPIQIVINADHTTQVSGFPEFDVLADGVICRINESGVWKLDRGPEPQVRFRVNSVPKSDQPKTPYDRDCSPTFDLSIVGHLTPYRLYWSFGGPDVDRGIEFERITR